MTSGAPTYYEFFAGGGMARAGLGPAWTCRFANDIDPMKAAIYAANWGTDHLLCEDVAKVRTSDLPGRADLAWASFPCQDLSLAGDGLGLGRPDATVATRSGTFWPFWALIKALKTERRAPRTIVLENVPGVLTSRGGKDFAAICAALAEADYRFGAIIVDALRFVPQSRPRVFFVAVEATRDVPAALLADRPPAAWRPRALVDGWRHLPAAAKRNWLWWAPPEPPARNTTFGDLVEDPPSGVRWHTREETARLLGLMSPIHRAKVKAAEVSGRRMVGGVYRRTRPDGLGSRRQRAEVRFDGVAGCLRTPSGGSSRQTILVVDGQRVRSRLLSPREAARLMGLPDDYRLPPRYNDAYRLAGDGVCVPAVRFIAANILEPLLENSREPVGLMAAE